MSLRIGTGLRIAALVLVGCGGGGAHGDASVVRTVTLTSDEFALPGTALRLADGTVLPPGMGDVWLAQRSAVTLNATPPLGICGVGTFDALAAVPTTREACIEAAPSDASLLTSNVDGTNQWVGRAWLIVDDVDSATPRPIYRLRALADSTENPHIVLTLAYEPILP